jgi:RNA:NAD 2'-phosphotransferase (TPT1/KptA family)
MNRLLRYCLGHGGLVPDGRGFIDVARFMYAVNKEGHEKSYIRNDNVAYVVATSSSQRFPMFPSRRIT